MLVAHQANVHLHPYTCANREDHVKDHEGLLVPTTAGWVCPECSYFQGWAWLPRPEDQIR